MMQFTLKLRQLNLPKTHARLSPSARHRWMRCPGSVREEAKYPDKSGTAAVDGTHSHTLLELCLSEKIDPMGLIGITLTDKDWTDDEGNLITGTSFIVDHDRAKRVKVCTDYVNIRLEETKGKLITETRVDPALFVDRDDMSGTIDIQIISDMFVEIIDFKDGMEVVSPCDNPQLEQYALGALCTSVPIGATRIRMTIVQPKCALKGQETISYQEVTRMQLVAKKDQMKKEAKATDDPDAPLIPGNVQCKWCRAKGNCSALMNHTLKEAGIMFPQIGSSEQFKELLKEEEEHKARINGNWKEIELSQQSADKDPNKMTDAQLSELLESAPLLRAMLSAAEEEALNRLKSGKTLPGFKLVYGPGSRDWSLSEEEIGPKLTRMGIPKSMLYTQKFVSVPQAMKLTWSKKDGTKKSLTDRQLQMLEKEYVRKSKGKLAIVPESDSRSAVSLVPDVAELFKPVQELPDWMK